MTPDQKEILLKACEVIQQLIDECKPEQQEEPKPEQQELESKTMPC